MFKGISILDGYLIPNPVYIYDFYVISLLVTFYKQARTHLFAHSKMVLSIGIVCTQLNGFKYCK